ncbi:MAG TPA: N-acetylglucosamine-6-phosphate deacetylase [Tissierellia bacterium]|nr:N-acetylglucosamine-6-phosphate deacetylase [Tissierellia bacterium]
MNILSGGSVVIDSELHHDLAIVFDAKIRSVMSIKDAVRLDARQIPFTGTLLPGFIDIHIHGAAGADTMDATFEALDTIARAISRAGTTSFLATTMTMSEESIINSLENVRSFMKRQSAGAQCLGIHLEGPFINPKYKGAHLEKYIQPPTRRWIDPFLDIIKLITLAPEMDPDHQFIKELSDQVVLSLGHSAATYEEAVESFRSGVRHVSHCFNAMSGMHHRRPGAVGAALNQPVSLDLITDLLHVHPDLFSLVIRQKGPEKTIAITDSMRAAFLEEGTYDLGGQKVVVKENTCRLPDGTLAGSVHRMDRALTHLIRHTNCSLPELSQIMSTSAAKLLGIDHFKGHINEGYDADMVIFDDQRVTDVYVGGKKQ